MTTEVEGRRASSRSAPPVDWDRVYRVEARRFGPAISPEHIAHDSFARVFAVDPNTITSARGLLYQTARNLALNQVKRASMAPERPADDIVALADATGATSSPEDAVLSSERVRAILAAIEVLPDTQRKALQMCKFESLPAQEIGKRLGVSPRHAYRLIVQAMERLRASLSDAS